MQMNAYDWKMLKDVKGRWRRCLRRSGARQLGRGLDCLDRTKEPNPDEVAAAGAAPEAPATAEATWRADTHPYTQIKIPVSCLQFRYNLFVGRTPAQTIL